jgi:hypothetical protein
MDAMVRKEGRHVPHRMAQRDREHAPTGVVVQPHQQDPEGDGLQALPGDPVQRPVGLQERHRVPGGPQGLADANGSLFNYSITFDGVPLTGLEDYLLDAAVAWVDYDGTEPSVLLRAKDRYGPGIPAEDVDCARGYDEGNICLYDPGPKAMATYGHGVMFRPLDDDQPHTLHVTGSRGSFAVDVTYTLNVEDED